VKDVTAVSLEVFYGGALVLGVLGRCLGGGRWVCRVRSLDGGTALVGFLGAHILGLDPGRGVGQRRGGAGAR